MTKLLAIGVVIALAGACEHTDEHADAVTAALQRMDGYCGRVRAALEVDAADLESGERARQTAAVRREHGSVALHSWDDIVLCASHVPTEVIDHDECSLRADFACLARLKRLAIAAVPEAPRRQSERASLARLQMYCAAVKDSAQSHGLGLQSVDPAARDKALATFLDDTSYSSELQIALCSTSPPSLLRAASCALDRDYRCLAHLAFEASRRIDTDRL